MPVLQATAAIGQPSLMALYAKALARHDLHAGQVLVSRHDFEERVRYVNISQHARRPAPAQGHPHHQRERHHRHRGARPLRRQRHHRRPDDQPAAGRPAGASSPWWTACSTATASAWIWSPTSTIVPGPRPDGQIHARQRRHGHQARRRQAGHRRRRAGGHRQRPQPNVLLRLLDGERVGTIFAPAAQQAVRPPTLARRRRPPRRHDRRRRRRRPGPAPEGKSLLASRHHRRSSGKFDRGDHRPRRHPRRPDHRPRHHQLQPRRN